MNKIQRIKAISEIASFLQNNYTTSHINVFLGGFGINNTGETIVPSKRVFVEQKLSTVSESILIEIMKELKIKNDVVFKDLSIHDLLQIKEKILYQLSFADISAIDLILDAYNAQSHKYWDFDNKREYIKFRISELKSETLIDILGYLDKRRSLNDNPDFWKGDGIRIFISHLSKDKIKASRLSLELEKYGICSFVAHEDIEPDEEWLEKIEQALVSMDLLLALVTDGFRDSNWTSQEIGFALGRGVPVISIRNGMDPFGFFGKKQAINGNGKRASEIAGDVTEIISKIPNLTEKLITK